MAKITELTDEQVSQFQQQGEDATPTLAEQVAADNLQREQQVNADFKASLERNKCIAVIIGKTETQLGGQQVTLQTLEFRAI